MEQQHTHHCRASFVTAGWNLMAAKQQLLSLWRVRKDREQPGYQEVTQATRSPSCLRSRTSQGHTAGSLALLSVLPDSIAQLQLHRDPHSDLARLSSRGCSGEQQRGTAMTWFWPQGHQHCRCLQWPRQAVRLQLPRAAICRQLQEGFAPFFWRWEERKRWKGKEMFWSWSGLPLRALAGLKQGSLQQSEHVTKMIHYAAFVAIQHCSLSHWKSNGVSHCMSTQQLCPFLLDYDTVSKA